LARMWSETLLEGLSQPDSKSRSESLGVALEYLCKGGAVGDYRSYLLELLCALSPCILDNNLKIATQAASIVETLCCCGSLPEGSMRAELDTIVPPLTELLGNAKVRWALRSSP